MTRISAAIFVFLAAIAPAIAADIAEPNVSVPDANPECMDRNGPDCVLGAQVVPSRVAAPPRTLVAPADPTGVVVVPAPTPLGTIAPPGMIVPQGVVGTPAPAPVTTTTTTVPGTSTVITPASPGVSIISPRR